MIAVPMLMSGLLFGQQPAQPDAQFLAQAYDRCMTTFAVRLTHTDASDDSIYSQATEGCQALREQMNAAIRAQLPAEQATEALQSMEPQARPNFIALLARIRSDRARRAAQ